jgi:hypothetical protein
MSYTNSEQVRHHLITPYPVADRVLDQAVLLPAVDSYRFHGGTVDADSVRVKSLQSTTPQRVEVTLTGGTASCGVASILSGSVVVASDSSLGTVYCENSDYVFDYTTGTLTTKSGGTLTDTQTVTIWYLPFTLYLSGTDYSLTADRGELRRLASGSIAVGERVWLDYEPVYVCVSDEIIANAVTMANGMVENEVDPNREFEADATLSTAATYRALEIVCRAAASRELAASRSGDRVASVWIKLADGYAERSELLLRSFRPPYDSPRNPVRS